MKQSAILPPFAEEDVDRSFMATMREYRRTLPKGLRQPLFSLRHRLLKRRCELTPAQQMDVADILWQHRGTALEEGYYMKEELKALLHSRSRAEMDARYAQVISRWKGLSLANTLLSDVVVKKPGEGAHVKPGGAAQIDHRFHGLHR